MQVDLDEPVFCFTSDLDWAPESMVDQAFRMFKDANVPVTPFVTHASDAVAENYRGDKAKYVGIHPNFLFDTTHGENVDAIITETRKLWPQATAFRSHYYVDSLFITQKFYNAGFKYDSNVCLFLQPNIMPLHLTTGLLRFPVFLDDSIYADRVGCTNLAYLIQNLFTPGLKIFNFHPIHLCLNTPNMKYYVANKEQIHAQKSWKHRVYEGSGILNVFFSLIDTIREQGFKATYLDDIYNQLKPSHPPGGMSEFFLRKTMTEKPVTNVSVWAGGEHLKGYAELNAESRSETVRETYNEMDGKMRYATSPDFNLRELEIDFITRTIMEQDLEESARVLDVGCGNGLTLLRLAQRFKADFTGLDFSSTMIEGAHYLKDRFEKLKATPAFNIGDARRTGFPDNHFDTVISERLLLNLPNEEVQKAAILEMHRVLKPGGLLIAVEGTRNGLRRLNALRVRVGLDEIPDISKTNVSSLKFEEDEIEAFFQKHFTILKRQHFGTYYLISRVLYPLLIAPASPRYDAKINEIAKRIALVDQDHRQMGHIIGYVLKRESLPD